MSESKFIHITEIFPDVNTMPDWMQEAFYKGQLFYEFKKRLDAAEAENTLLRRLLWLRHGCTTEALYGDDGQMHCNRCLIDFKELSAEDIDKRFVKLGFEALKAINITNVLDFELSDADLSKAKQNLLSETGAKTIRDIIKSDGEDN